MTSSTQRHRGAHLHGCVLVAMLEVLLELGGGAAHHFRSTFRFRMKFKFPATYSEKESSHVFEILDA